MNKLSKAKRMNIALMSISHTVEETAEIVGCHTTTVRNALKAKDVMAWREELLETRRKAMNDVLAALTRQEMISPEHPDLAQLIEAKLADLDAQDGEHG